jgi:hypothetical protein
MAGLEEVRGGEAHPRNEDDERKDVTLHSTSARIHSL